MAKRKVNSAIRQISFDPDKRVDVFRSLTETEKTEVLYWLTPHIKKDLLTSLDDEEVLEVLEKVDPDEATDMMQLLGKRKRERLLEHLSENLKDTVADLLQFDPDTAAGLMTLDYIIADISDTVEGVARKFKAHERKTGRQPVMLALKDGKLAGFMPGHELGFARKTDRITNYIKRVPTIRHSADHDDVIELFRSHPHNKVAVLDDNGNVAGIIYSDDVLKLMHDQEASTLYDFAGIHEEESVTDTTSEKVHHRYKWLIINLGTAFLAAFTVSLFQDTLSKYVLLAIYMPIVAGMGGNAATQTLAVMVRGISQRQIDTGSAVRALKNEMGAGFVNGLINGVIVAAVVLVLNHDAKVALVLALAMVINMVVAGLFGTVVPLIMERLGKDPASSATIFITTATDVLGFLAFLGLGTLILAR
jgi:magnesium transporter